MTGNDESANDAFTPTDVLGLFQQLFDRANARIDEVQQVAVEPGSAVAQHDAELRVRSYQETLTLLISSAFDHVRLCAASVRALQGVLPFATATPIRTSITVGATALWLLDGEPDDRRLRTLQYWHADFCHMHDALKEQAKDNEAGWSSGMRQSSEVSQRVIKERLAKLRGNARDFGHTRATLTDQRSDTKMVFDAGRYLEPDIFNGRDPKIELSRQWRILSGHAHGRRWALEGGIAYGEADANGWGELRLEASLLDMFGYCLTAHTLAEAALTRYKNLASGS
ncbi:hypothetical protein [Rhodococcus ruber]|uniref:hypothetical protein n=1 Tax=Rhodococcus ruber TaxID=1830 RepID=UPI001F34149C|nr:hypothetical protein [Rhodococcus ruber]MCF8786887.1 hypothetical protein [Rhodococcus ruber]